MDPAVQARDGLPRSEGQAGQSRADFISKLGIVEEEADESAFWLEVLSDAGVMRPGRLAALLKEADELTAIIVAMIKTAKRKR